MTLFLALPPLAGSLYFGGWPHVLASLFGCALGWLAVRRMEKGGKP